MIKLFNTVFLKKFFNIDSIELNNVLNCTIEWSYIYINKGKTKKKICVPSDNFKSYLRILLLDFEKRAKCHPAVFSYQKGKSFKDLALLHVGNAFLLKTDIKNFFDSITQEQVEQCLTAFYDTKMSIKITNMVCFEDKLPFGSPFSPYLSNILLKGFDEYCEELCLSVQAVYSRYSDDIFISSNDKESLPNLLASISEYLKHNYNLMTNEEKTSIVQAPYKIGNFTAHDDKVNLCKDYRRLLRVKLHKYSTSELSDNEELASLKGSILFCKGNDSEYFSKLYAKFEIEIDEILSTAW